MQSENLLRSDYPMEHISNSNMSNSNSPVNSPVDQVSKSLRMKYEDKWELNNKLGNAVESTAILPEQQQQQWFFSEHHGRLFQQ